MMTHAARHCVHALHFYVFQSFTLEAAKQLAHPPSPAPAPASTTRSTHVPVVASQRWPGQASSEVHPTRHVNVVGSQIGAARPQSSLEMQATHVLVRSRHRGFCPGQLASDSHSTHRARSVEQIPVAQSALLAQPTQAPDTSSQIVPDGQSLVLAQRAWQS